MLREVVIQKDSPIPLYYQLKEIIKEQIDQGNMQPGEMIPSERELVELFQISRPTVRQAINELVNEGLLIREKGLGTFVAKPKIKQWFLETLTSFHDEMRQKGLPYFTKVLEKEIVGTNSTLSSIFGADQDQFIRLERLRYVKDEPVVLVTTYVPISIAPGLADEDFTSQSLYDILQTRFGLNIESASRTMEAISVAEEDAHWLELAPSSAIMLIKTIGYVENEKPFEYSIARYRGDLSSFTVNLRYSKP